MDAERIAKISKNAVNEDGSIKHFKEQLTELNNGLLLPSTELVVAPNSAMLLPAITHAEAISPMVMSQSIVRKVMSGRQDHNLSLSELADLPKSMTDQSVLMMQSRMRSDSVVVVLAPESRNNLFVALNIHATANRHSANRILSVYERGNLSSLISHTWDDGLKLYPNEKTRSWSKSIGLQLPKELISFLENDYTYISKSAQAPSRLNLILNGVDPTQAELIVYAYTEQYSQDSINLLSDPEFTREQSIELLRLLRAQCSEQSISTLANPALSTEEMAEMRMALVAKTLAPLKPETQRGSPEPGFDATRARQSCTSRNNSEKQVSKNPSHGRT